MSGFGNLIGSLFSGREKKTHSAPKPHPIPGLAVSSQPAPYPPAAKVSPEERAALYATILKPDLIDLDTLRDLAFKGIPDSPTTLRATYWKWSTSLADSRQKYQNFRSEFIVDATSLSERPADEDNVRELFLHRKPLSQSANSQWQQYFKDNALVQEIDRDIKSFFNQTGTETETRHYKSLRQLLFIYAKLNPGIRYVQGMNEIVAPVYYVFANDPDNGDHAEADAFFCFTALMSEIRDNFSKTVDQSEFGVIAHIRELNQLFRSKDPELWQDLEEKRLDPQFYTFRWLTLLLSQEFELPDVIRLWDSLFADSARFRFLQYFCVAMIVCVRDELFNGDYADNLKLLQHYPPIDPKILFQRALDLQNPHYIAPPRPAPIAKPPPDDSEYEVY